eukprot:3431013-Pleurochrysis_carterae.AAC.1
MNSGCSDPSGVTSISQSAPVVGGVPSSLVKCANISPSAGSPLSDARIVLTSDDSSCASADERDVERVCAPSLFLPAGVRSPCAPCGSPCASRSLLRFLSSSPRPASSCCFSLLLAAWFILSSLASRARLSVFLSFALRSALSRLPASFACFFCSSCASYFVLMSLIVPSSIVMCRFDSRYSSCSCSLCFRLLPLSSSLSLRRALLHSSATPPSSSPSELVGSTMSPMSLSCFS